MTLEPIIVIAVVLGLQTLCTIVLLWNLYRSQRRIINEIHRSNADVKAEVRELRKNTQIVRVQTNTYRTL